MGETNCDEWNITTLKEHFDTLFDKIEDRFNEHIKVSENTTKLILSGRDRELSASFSAQEKAMNAAFLSSEKAILKAEEAQKEYNTHSNNFRGQIDDQAKNFATRLEVVTFSKTFEDKTTILQANLESKLAVQEKALEDRIGTLQRSVEKTTDGLAIDIKTLREFRSETFGQSVKTKEMIAYFIALTAIAVGILSHYIH